MKHPIGMAAVLASSVFLSWSSSSASAEPLVWTAAGREGSASSAPSVASRLRLAEAAQDRSLAPWQREVMLQVAQNDHRHPATPAQPTNLNGDWSFLGPPRERSSHIAIHDPVRDRMIVFGGTLSGTLFDDVWTLSLGDDPEWRQLKTWDPPPAPRMSLAAIYDPVRDRLILFGGQTDPGFRNDVWALPLSGNPIWTELKPAGTPPGRRRAHTAIYDPVRDRMLVFGGSDFVGSSYVYRNDVWALSLGDAPGWTLVTPEGSPPVGRDEHSAIYDPIRDRMIVFGGYFQDPGPRYLNDTWALNLSGTPTWTPVTPTGVLPSPRFHHAAIYDPASDGMIVYSGSYLDEVWKLTFGTVPAWTRWTPAGLDPGGRLGTKAIHDPLRCRMIAFGGYNAPSQYFNDVLALSLDDVPTWSNLMPFQSTTSIASHSAILDAPRDRMLVFGGETPWGYSNEVRALSLVGSLKWMPLSPGGSLPGGRSRHTAIHDPVRDRMVVFGGSYQQFGAWHYLNEVWALSLAGPLQWTQLSPAGIAPSGRNGHAAIYDPAEDRMLVIGGYNPAFGRLNDVWAMSLGENPTWVQLDPSGPLPSVREGHSAVYDPGQDRVLVFGGVNSDGADQYRNDLWSLALGQIPAWTELAVSTPSPAPRARHIAIHDPLRQRIVIYGGRSTGWYGLGDLWSLALGAPAWSKLAPTGTSPGMLAASSAIYDPGRDRMLAFGGFVGTFVHQHDPRLWSLDWSQTVHVSPPVSSDNLWLAPAHPNPSRGDVWFEFTLPHRGRATLRIFDVSGRLVRTLLDEALAPGSKSIRWDRRLDSGPHAQPGLYFSELRTTGSRATRRLVLAR